MQNQVESTTLPLLLTVAKAVTVSGLSRSQIYLRLSDGTLHRKKIGRSTLVVTSSLLEMLDRLPQ